MDIRTSRPEDVDRVAGLIVSRLDPGDGVDARLLMTDPDAGCDWVGVAADGDRIVSTLTLMDETVTLAGLDIPAGQVEQVATDVEHEGRGLVRRLMGWAHDRSAERGHLVQFVMGVPYFYRQFGYVYSIPVKQNRALVETPHPVAGHTLRRATEADIPVLQALQDAAQRGADLRMGHTTPCWRWLLHRTGSTTWVVERDGVPVATGRSTPEEEGDVVLGEVAGVDDDAVKALVALVNPALVGERHPALEPLLADRAPELDQCMVRIPDVPKLLEHLRPVFTRRLCGHEPTEVVLGFFRTHVRFHWDGEEIGPFEWGGTLLGPGAVGGAGIAPDLLAPLLFGPHGMDGLRRIFPDVYPGPKAELMTRLFPPVTSDLLTFYLP
ncbi:GNAT family N-acetyltransferase [Lentzea sp. CC55]|uniref:GNAT family N-acetyltransferase n=1 Tax=Lentzea sp. CC55 TaxID=2884909 RepID=UPI0027E141D3|nr:GNAT family N-acetyltransferase [Lentzea sp. CC55]MCG8925688.1 GNAT family N-acetyltransferase [Lentzea sp. CC55]